MIENHDFFLFVSNRDHNSLTILNRQLNKIACNLLEVLTKCQFFFKIIYCKICTSSVDNIIFIMILKQQKLSDSVQILLLEYPFWSELNMQD